jgi:hypothetical protein
MQILQLNMQKRREVQHSVMNDPSLKEYTALAISELYVFEMDGKVRTSPMGRQSWTAILPSHRHDGRWAVRSMLWVRKDIEAAAKALAVSDAQAVQRDSGTGGRLRVLVMDARQEGQCSNHEHTKVRAIYVVGLTSMAKDNELEGFVCFNFFEMDVNYGT